MLRIVQDDLWIYYKLGWHVVIPTNSITNKKGQAIMGTGLAMQANRLFKKLDNALGNLIDKHGSSVFLFERQRLIMFPTKKHWRSDSTIEQIIESCKTMKRLLERYKDIKIAMPKVGCGFGNLKWEDVCPIIERYFGDLSPEKFMIVDNEQKNSPFWLGRNRNKEVVEKEKKPLIKEVDGAGNTIKEIFTEEEYHKDEWEKRKKEK